MDSLLWKNHFTTVGKETPPCLTNHCEVRGGCMYDAFHLNRVTMIISYVACYLSQ